MPAIEIPALSTQKITELLAAEAYCVFLDPKTNQQISNKILLDRIVKVQHFLSIYNIKSCAVFHAEVDLFLISLMACAGLGIDIIIPANTKLQFISGLDVACFLGDFENLNFLNISAQHLNSEQLKQLFTADIPNQKNNTPNHNFIANFKDTTLSIYTSGSSGEPKAIARNFEQVIKEIATLESLWGLSVQGCLFTASVSHCHIYGLLFRLLWPFLTQRPISLQFIAFEEILIEILNQYPTCILISSPAFLKRLSEHNFKKINNTALSHVFSSGGKLENEEAKRSAAILGVEDITQIYGSSETGGIAYKNTKLNSYWHLLPLVEMQINDQILSVKSPYCYQSNWLNTNDLVRLHGDYFELLGRADSIAKIEEKRVSLLDIEYYLAPFPLIADVRALALKRHRDYIALVIVLSDEGKRFLQYYGKNNLNNKIKLFLSTKFENVLLPKQIRIIDQIPMNAQGKTSKQELKALFL